MSTTSAMRAFYLNLPPRGAGKQKVVALAAASQLLATVWGADVPKNKCMISVENASAATITVGFGTGAATAVNGAAIAPGMSRKFWISPFSDTAIAVSAVASAYICSPEFDGPSY